MKNKISLLLMVLMVVTLTYCGSKKTETQTEDYGAPVETTTPVHAVDVIAQGDALVKASDCKTCHHATNKLIGPSHTDVAKKYEFTAANVTYLAKKIIEGGTGVWGEIPMTPHADISQVDAEKMARYVLSLDGETEH
ncbi:MAG: cytochrome c class I [Bacteroidetes bacterium OLB12]|nr:MAG: cytochrome c class I [Bacteroidetes bacterium OLB12]HNR74982.1 cytochrome c class I [Cyclobacteriaceae bacterium]HNU43296.1 cytochrome c class I [Cyclobacteriaceae bacterium]